MKINLISVDNGVGLTQDVNLVREILKPHQCKFINVKGVSHEKADINIFFEILNEKFYPLASKNLFFPNPEWFYFAKKLKDIDLVLCKTRDTERIFNKLGCATIYTSFTSRDLLKEMPKQRQYIHLAGKSSNKGTPAVFQAWNSHPLPMLIFCKADKFDQYEKHSENITTLWGRMTEPDLIRLMNTTAFHVCPSEYEGFGHYIWEAKSTGGIVITTKAEPMSDFVREGVDGFTVDYDRRSHQSLGTLYFVSPKALQKVIERTEALTDQQILDMGKQSRLMWEDNDKFFKNILKLIINEIAK